ARAELAQEQGGDEEARDAEEDVDTEEAPRQRCGPQVEDEDGSDGERPDPVEAVDVARLRGGARRRRASRSARRARGTCRRGGLGHPPSSRLVSVGVLGACVARVWEPRRYGRDERPPGWDGASSAALTAC